MLTLDQFRNRAMTVRTLVFCDKCETLKDESDVKERANYWPRVEATVCCADCFRKLMDAALGLGG